MIGPSGTADFIDGNTTIFSSNSYFHAKKENVKIIASDNVVEDSMLARRNSSSF